MVRKNEGKNGRRTERTEKKRRRKNNERKKERIVGILRSDRHYHCVEATRKTENKGKKKKKKEGGGVERGGGERNCTGLTRCELRSFSHRLVGLMVKASASRAEGPGFESRLRRDFFGVESYQ